MTFKLLYGESYTGTINEETTKEGYQYCTSLDRAFQLLMSESVNNFVLAIGYTAVAIYCKGNVGLKIFHSHARDIMEDAIPKVHVCCEYITIIIELIILIGCKL